MFCGFISFFLLLNYYYYYLLYGIYEHTQTNTHIQQNQASNMCCSFFGRVMYDFEMHFFCFLITKSSYASHPGNTILLTAKS